MALRGDLASVDLAQVFQMLALNKKVGLLSIQSAKLWRILYFDHRGVTVHHNVHQLLDRAVAAFVRSGRLDQRALDEVREHSVRMGQPLADSLLAGGYVDPTELEQQYRIELEEQIYDLFFWREAKFEFHENVTSLEGRDGTIDERFFFNCDSIIMEAARRIDEWAYISERIPTTAEVLVAVVDEIDVEDYGRDGAAVFELLDGRRNVARIVEQTGLNNFQVCKALSQLMDAGAIAPVAQEELLPLAAECMTEGRLRDAISLYERAIELDVGLPETYALVAKAYQVAEEYELASYHLQCEAEHRIGTGDLAGAAACLTHVKQLVPTDLQARERLVELTLGPGGARVDGFDPLAEGKELVELLLEFGDIQRVRALLERLLLVEPDDPDLKKALVNVHVRAGDQKRVVQLYESIADDLVRQHKPLEAVGYLQKILLLDRSRSDISERVRRLYEFDERARRRSRALGALAVLICLLLVLGSGYWFYNERSEEEFARIDVAEMVAHEDFAGAAAAYEQFVQQHPLTTAIGKAAAELQKIEAARQLFEARRASERAARDRALQRLRDQYRSEWARHREQFRGGDPEAALASVERVRALVDEAGGADDMAWALEQQVERTHTNLREFLAESERLVAAYDGKLAAGDWQAARQLALELHERFEYTAGARRAHVPVMVVTRPAGARLLHDGKPLLQQRGAAAEPLATPGLVLCPPGQAVALTTDLAGFEPKQIVVDGKAADRVDAVLAVVPERRVAFELPAQTGVGVGEGWLAIGLRGGRVGVMRVDGSGRRIHELGGLRAADAAPAIQNGRVFFSTNENTVECLAVDPAVRVQGWPVSLSSHAATPLSLGDGRAALVDDAGVLHCWEQATARRAWGASLGGAPGGPPTFARRRVWVGTSDGRVLAFDATDGKSLGVLRADAGIVTRIHADSEMLFFGCSDGSVRAVDFASGRILWSWTANRAPRDRDLALGARLVVAAEDRVLALDRVTGAVAAELPVDGEVLGVGVQGARAVVQVRRPRTKNLPVRDVVIAMQIDTLEVAWEYGLDDVAPGLCGHDDLVLALPTAAGEVILFR